MGLSQNSFSPAGLLIALFYISLPTQSNLARFTGPVLLSSISPLRYIMTKGG